MTTAADFVREILAAKTDADRDSARLVFADWLEERGDPAAKIMRAEGCWDDWRPLSGITFWDVPSAPVETFAVFASDNTFQVTGTLET